MQTHDVHEQVAKAYTEALSRAQARTGGCCGGGAPAEASTAAALAGYGADAEKHADVAATSFGCGNPVALAGIGSGDTVVDLGSGAGLDLLLARERVGETGRVIGIDMTDAMIETARRNVARAAFTNVEIRKGVIEHLPVDDASVDWVISNCVINLSPDKPAVFREIARVLRPGGRFSVSDIVVESLPDWVRANADAYVACVAGAISEADYVAGLTAAGLTDVVVTDRLVYSADQIQAIVSEDLGSSLKLDCDATRRALAEVEGKVWSARVTGRRPR
jgi:SAM-dependent methyltransferase